jgi:hypothetical protein
MYIPKLVNPDVAPPADDKDAANSKTWEGFLGQASNPTPRPVFGLLSTDTCHNALVLCHGDTIVPPLFAAGDSFTLADIEGTCTHLAPLLPADWGSYRLAKIPLCVPINFGVAQTCKG